VNIAKATNSSYTVTNATSANAGSYTVVVSNVVATVTSAPPATLTLQYAPAITAQPSNQTVFLAGRRDSRWRWWDSAARPTRFAISGTTAITPPHRRGQGH